MSSTRVNRPKRKQTSVLSSRFAHGGSARPSATAPPFPLCDLLLVVRGRGVGLPLPTQFVSVSDHSYHQAERGSRKRAKVTAKAAAIVREAHVAVNDAADARVAADLNRTRARARRGEDGGRDQPKTLAPQGGRRGEQERTRCSASVSAPTSLKSTPRRR